MKMAEVSAEMLEEKMRLAEKMLEKAGAVPLEINQKNREILRSHASDEPLLVNALFGATDERALRHQSHRHGRQGRHGNPL